MSDDLSVVTKGSTVVGVRRSVRAAVVGAALVASSVVAAAPAHASASGCTWAPGGAFAQQCIHVWGSGLRVDKVANQYFPSPLSGYSANVCRREHQDKFTDLDNQIRYHHASLDSCIPGAVAVAFGDYEMWYPHRDFHDHRGMCAQSKNSDTGDTWTPFACVTVHS